MFLLSVGWSPLVARAPAFSAALVAAWLLHGAYTFGVRDRLTTRSFRRFAVLALSIAGINYLIYAGLVVHDVWPPVAIAISTGICSGVSYFAYRFFAFR